jgi:hypothetical protein
MTKPKLKPKNIPIITPIKKPVMVRAYRWRASKLDDRGKSWQWRVVIGSLEFGV